MTWNYLARRSLTARGQLCPHCQKTEMRPALYAELREIVRNGQWTQQEFKEACEDYCLGHFDEWIPDFVITEEM